MRRRFAVPIPRPPFEAQSDSVGTAEVAAMDAATTLACRTPVGIETLSADGKAAIILTLLGIMFTVLARFGTELSEALRAGGVQQAACGSLLIAFAACSLCAVVQAFRTIAPRFRRDKPSLAYFGKIASLHREEYFEQVESLTMREALDQIMLYNHTASRICALKFKQLRWCLRCFEMASGCWAILALIVVVKSLLG